MVEHNTVSSTELVRKKIIAVTIPVNWNKIGKDLHI